MAIDHWRRFTTERRVSQFKTEVALVPDVGKQSFDLGFQVRRQGQEGQPRGPAEVAVEIHAVFYTGDAEIADDALRGVRDAVLLQAGKVRVSFFPCSVNLIACSWRGTGKGQNRADGSGVERRLQLLGSTHHHLEADFLLTRFHLAHDGYGGRRWLPFGRPWHGANLH